MVLALAAGCDAVDTSTGGLSRAEYGKRIQALCVQNVQDIRRYDERFGELGDRYESDPDYSYVAYWKDLWQLEVEGLEDNQRFLRGVEKLEEPLSAGNGGKAYKAYLRRSVELNEKVVKAARQARNAVEVNPSNEAPINRYDAAVRRQVNYLEEGFVGDRAFGNLLDSKAPACLKEL